MAEKDITEKILADYNDVFADIINVLLFQGRQEVAPDDLESVKDISQYKADGRVHEQERDVSKILKKEHLTIPCSDLSTRQRQSRSCRSGSSIMTDSRIGHSCFRKM